MIKKTDTDIIWRHSSMLMSTLQRSLKSHKRVFHAITRVAEMRGSVAKTWNFLLLPASLESSEL